MERPTEPGAPSLALMLAAGGGAMLAGALLFAILFVHSLDAAGRQLALAGSSQDQLLLVTKIDAAIADLAQGNGDALMIRRLLAGYRGSIRQEEALSRAPRSTAIEERDVARFEALLAGPGRGIDLTALRALTTRIVARERAEVAQVAGDARALQRRARTIAIALVAALLGALTIAGILLYRLVMRPVAALAEGARRLGAGQDGHVPAAGPAELRLLAVQFNRMVDRVGAQQSELETAVHLRTVALSERNARLAAVDRNRRLFFSKVSHELRTPVSVMRGEAEVALRTASGAAAALGHVVANADFLQRRLDDLLGLARSEEGRLTLERAPVDLAALARDALTIAAPFAQSSEVALIGSGLGRPIAIGGDAVWLRQALLAAIDNAIKFSALTPVRLRLVGRAGKAALVLLDRGPGIGRDEMGRVFDPYVQTEEGRARGGSGLGLSLARWVIEQHDGRIEARARRGGGLAIVMTLPRA